jgi:hypothetical protein
MLNRFAICINWAFCCAFPTENRIASLLNTPDAVCLQNVDWEKFIRIIRQNQLQTVYKAVLDSLHSHGKIPDIIYKQLVVDQLVVTHQASLQKKEFIHVVKTLSRARVHFLVMKTFLYSTRLFGKNPLKISCDLDLLIPVNEFQRISALLIHDGYVWYENHHRKHTVVDYINDFYIPREEEIFQKGAYEIELHTTIVDTYSFESLALSDKNCRRLTQELFNSAVKINYLGLGVYTFSPTDLVISLFLHSYYQHNFIGLLRYYEVAKLIQHYSGSIRWSRIFSIIEKYNLTIYFLWYLSFFTALFPSALPQHVTQRVTAFQEKLTGFQLIIYYFMLHKVFYPNNEFSDKQKGVIWAMMGRKFGQYVISALQNRLKIIVR